MNQLRWWSKLFSLIACIKEDDVLTFLILGSIFDHAFVPKKDKFLPCICFSQRYAQCHLWSCAISTERRLKHFINISWNNSIPVTVFTIQYSTLSLTESQFIFLKCNESIWDLRGKLWQKRINLFWAFWSLSFKFFFKKGNYEENL